MDSPSSACSAVSNGSLHLETNSPTFEHEFYDADSLFLLHILCSQASFMNLSDSREFVDVIYKLSKVIQRFLFRRYTHKQICLKLGDFKRKMITFNIFLLTPGVEYDPVKNIVSVGDDYWMRFPFGLFNGVVQKTKMRSIKILAEQLVRVLNCSGSMHEQEKIMHVSEWKVDGQDGKCNDEDDNGMVQIWFECEDDNEEETLWFECETQLEELEEEEMSERELGSFPGVGEAASEMDKSVEAEKEIKTGQNMENLGRTSTSEHKDAKGNEQKGEMDNLLQRIGAIKRGREREKARIVVERAFREARERAFVEARERAECAAVERDVAEARQSVMEKAQEKTRKASVQTKAFIAERFSSSSKSSSSSDLKKCDGALAEKIMCDILAEKEQAERTRLAESLDADIKRWVSEKEGNLRALLSTLQYILGPDSGWEPVTLTKIVTTDGVKKAYRKAILCVHPDKLQQRRATIQQKYICEKIFYLLKAAWNRFKEEN